MFKPRIRVLGFAGFWIEIAFGLFEGGSLVLTGLDT